MDDESRAEAEIGSFEVKKPSFDPSYATDLRKQRKRGPMSVTHGNRPQRELTVSKKPAYPSLTTQIRNATGTEGLLPIAGGRRGVTSPIVPTLSRNRSTSPNLPRHHGNLSATSLTSRRGSWQSSRKTIKELERECDEDDGDDLPDDVFLQNIPISPRPPSERVPSNPVSTSTSPDRAPKEKVRNVGNGTSHRPAEQGQLRSPYSGMHRAASMGQFPIHDYPKGRAKSWTAALSDLNDEAKALTEALEEHADVEDSSMDYTRSLRVEKQRVKSAIAELPPLRRTDIMIDPLPISKEKEAVLSRTRPSWLPPKNPAEEKRHLKEYQKMMVQSLQAEKKREAERSTRTTCRDDTASSLLRIWEEHVLPNWEQVTKNKRTRELWWRGVAPRSRGAVWQRAIGNELGLTDSSYKAALRRAQALEKTISRGSGLSSDEERKKGWLDQIQAEASQTYPDLRIFQQGGPLHNSLMDVLKAYAMYRSDVGYISGTSTIAAILLLNLPSPSSTFIALSNILNRPLPLSFHTSDTGATSRVFILLMHTLSLKSPHLHTHLTTNSFSPDTVFTEIFSSLFTKCLSLDQATRLWDIMVFEGDAIAVRAGVAYLGCLESKLFAVSSQSEVDAVLRNGLGGAFDEEDWIARVKGAGKS